MPGRPVTESIEHYARRMVREMKAGFERSVGVIASKVVDIQNEIDDYRDDDDDDDYDDLCDDDTDLEEGETLSSSPKVVNKNTRFVTFMGNSRWTSTRVLALVVITEFQVAKGLGVTRRTQTSG